MARPFVKGSKLAGSKLALIALVALPLSLAAREASASYSYTINGNLCKVLQNDDESLVAPSGTTLTASGSVQVICPMVKHTSGPNGFNDYISDVTATVVAGAGGVSCHLNIYNLQVYKNSHSLEQEGSGTASVGPNSHQQTLDLFGFSSQTFFDHATASPYTYWNSSEIICSMTAGTTLKSFNVTENGSLLSNYRIYSASNCTPTQPNKSAYQFIDGHFGGEAGYWEANQSAGFVINCPVPADAGRGVQLSVGPSISGDGSDQLQCTGDGGSHWITIPQNVPASDYPTTTVSFAFKSGAQNIQCKMITNGDNDGDGKVLAYRSFPLDPIPHTGWSATASIGANPNSAFDGNLSSRWSTGQSQRSGQSYKLDMGGAKSFIEVVIDSTGDANDYPHGYTIESSLTGANGSWTTLATGTGTGAVVTVPVPMTTARYIRINQTGTDSHWWSIHELNVYSSGPHNPYL